MPIQAGDHLGPYEIVAAIGAGGMGEVYRARDTNLGRDVAIKVLPEAFTRDPDRMARFGREAKLLAALDHSNIASIYGLETSGAARALVMQLAEGPTLAERIAQGPLPIDDALRIARQIADALEYAHEKGIIHRDLKPSNVKVTSDDAVKILDFGLAKTMQVEASFGDATTSPTISAMATKSGVLLGTAAYMSPEQARGKLVDRRADIWAFGCVLYEMLTGKMAFGGGAITDTLAAVLKSEPDWSQLPTGTPTRVRVLLQRCLQKDPKQRLRDIGDARISLEEVLSGAPEPAFAGTPQGAVPTWRRGLPWAVTGLVFILLGPFAFLYFRGTSPAPAEPVRFRIPVPQTIGNGGILAFANGLALSPDGRQLAFIALGADGISHVWVRALDSLDARILDGTQGASYLPFWSPDSRYVAFESLQLGRTGIGGQLEKVAIAGGPAEPICDVRGSVLGGAWNREGEIVFSIGSGDLMRVSAAGGTPSTLVRMDAPHGDNSYAMPSFLPDSRHFFYSWIGATPAAGTYIGSLDAGVQTPGPRLLTASPALYVSNSGPGSGHLLFPQNGQLLQGNATLMAQGFDTSRAKLEGDPIPIAEGVSFFTVSGNGALAYAKRATAQFQLTWFDRQGKARGTASGPSPEDSVTLSPEGSRAFAFSSGQATGIWLLDFSRGTRSRFTFGSSPAGENSGDAVWSPDGSRVIFISSVGGSFTSIYEKLVSGTTDEVLLLKSADVKHPRSWSPDGKLLFYDGFDAGTGRASVWALPLEGDEKPRPFLRGNFDTGGARVSPDGRFIAYSSDETGVPEVYVRAFSPDAVGGTSDAGGKWQISSGGGTEARWRGDSRELYYLTPGGKVMAVEITTSSTFQAGTPKELFQGPPLRFQFGVSMPSQRALRRTESAFSSRSPRGKARQPRLTSC